MLFFNMQFTLKTLCIYVLLIISVEQIAGTYNIPEVTIEALKPQGLRFSMPDGDGVKFVEFHANINEDIKEKELGQIFNRISAAYQDHWQFTDKSVSLKKGDVLNYWILVWNNGETFTKHGLTYKVEDLVA